ncbi:MAG TPA: glycosyltransferase family 39 protein [Chloroflexota bacterium]|nr:glycosyltransferase family 39 protein [Chloroflexota bacterium]
MRFARRAVGRPLVVTLRRAQGNHGRATIAAWALLLVAALALRLGLLVRSSWLLEGDDALSTLMAFDVLHGQWPIMLKNQTYAAAWEPYAMATSYVLFGVSRVSAKLPALLGSVATMGTGWLLTRTIAGPVAGWFAAALAAVPPIYVLVLGLKPWAPYTEVILLGSLCLVCALRVGWPRSTCQQSTWWACGCGATGGVAFWMHPLAIWYLLPAALVFLLKVREPRLYVLALAGFLIGALPVWTFNLQTGGSTLQFVLKGSGGQTADRFDVLQAWWNNDLPRGAGLWHPWGPSPWLAGAAMALGLMAALLWALFARRGPLNIALLFLLTIPTVLVLSGFGGPALNPYGFDATGRYAPPIWFGLVVVLGAVLAAVWRARRWLAVLLATIPIGVNLLAYSSIDPLEAFQSPYWAKLPASNEALLSTLRAHGVEAIWLNHWAALPVMFDARAAGQPLIAYDWYDVQAGGIDRVPEYLSLVRQAARPAFVLVTEEGEPALVRRLREMQVSFDAYRVPPYVVVIPTSRRVDPSEVTGELDYRY